MKLPHPVHCLARRRLHASPSRGFGFTLLELLVVVLIIGLLTGIVAPRFLGQVSRSEVTTAAQGLKALSVQPTDEPRWRGPYLQGEVPTDPWGTAYVYRNPGSPGREYDLLSLGKDRVAGGTGDDADLVK